MLNQEIINNKMKLKAVTSEENAMFLFFVSIILKTSGHVLCILTALVKLSVFSLVSSY